MPTIRLSTTVSIGGVSISGRTDRTAEGQVGQQVSLAAGKTGTLTTRTDNDTGVATMTAGHGLTTGDKCDVFWATGARYGMAATVATNAVTLDAGGGDNLPTTSTALVVCKETVITSVFDGDTALMLAAMSTQRGYVQFQESDNTVIFATELGTANEPFTWVYDQGIANPITGDPVGQIVVSNASSTTAATFTVGALLDTVP